MCSKASYLSTSTRIREQGCLRHGNTLTVKNEIHVTSDSILKQVKLVALCHTALDWLKDYMGYMGFLEFSVVVIPWQ